MTQASPDSKLFQMSRLCYFDVRLLRRTALACEEVPIDLWWKCMVEGPDFGGAISTKKQVVVHVT